MFLTVLTICIGLFVPPLLTAYFLSSVIREIKTKFWPTVEGKIITSNVEGDSHYFPRILYEYRINGQNYKSRRIDYVSSTGNGKRIEAEDLIAPYHPGKLVLVHYDPKNPQLAVLEPGFKGFSAYVGIIIAVALYSGTFGAFAVISMLHSIREIPIIGWIAIVASFSLGVVSGVTTTEHEEQQEKERDETPRT